MAWEDVILDMTERERLEGEIDFPEDGSQPPQPDWYIAFELSLDLQIDLFTLEGLPMEEPFISIAKTWAIIRREAQALAARIRNEAADRDARLSAAAGRN